jgi:hypothetical protein
MYSSPMLHALDPNEANLLLRPCEIAARKVRWGLGISLCQVSLFLPIRRVFHWGALWSCSLCQYTEPVRLDVRRLMNPSQMQRVARITKELGIYVMIF